MTIRRIGTGETGAPLVLAELSPDERLALLNILTLAAEGLPRFPGLAGCSDGRDVEQMAAALREAFRLDADPAEAEAEAEARTDERRKCAAEIRADASLNGCLMPLILAATLDAADVIDPDVKVKAKWAASR